MNKWEKIIGIFVGIILILGAVYLLFSSYYKINYLEEKMKNKELEIGQIRSKINKSNQVVIDFLLKSQIDQKIKDELKKRLDEINLNWTQFKKGGEVQGPAMVDKKITTKQFPQQND